MTATRVIDDHSELAGAGRVTHAEIDDAFVSGSFLVVSGSFIPAGARILVSGPGIIIKDNGPGSTLIISASASTSQVNFSWNEIPTGDVDGANRTFVFTNTPNPSNAFMLFLNGAKQREGASSDFVLSGSTVIFAPDNIPRNGANIDATYQY
jgi:hypothetical protein